jgi:hypothetical protein
MNGRLHPERLCVTACSSPSAFSFVNSIFCSLQFLIMDPALVTAGSLPLLKTGVLNLYNVIGSGRSYGTDFVKFCSLFTVECARFIKWGETVGLAQTDIQAISSASDSVPLSPSPVNRLFTDPTTQRAIVDLLGYVEMVSLKVEVIQRSYEPKRLAYHNDDNSINSDLNGRSVTVVTDRAQSVMKSISKQAYANLRNSAKEYQQRTSLLQKARWATIDKKKFQSLISEFKGYNNILFSLLPSINTSVISRIPGDATVTSFLQSAGRLCIEDSPPISDVAGGETNTRMFQENFESQGPSTIRSKATSVCILLTIGLPILTST